MQRDAAHSKNKSTKLILRFGEKRRNISPDHALALAHSLLRAKKYDCAAKICEVVTRCECEDPRAAILLACCRAGLKEYAVCNQILREVFSGDKAPLAERLQAAFVYDNLGMERDAARELTAIVDEDPNRPMVWLLLGDELHLLGMDEKAALCWQLAIDRDRKEGPAALAAKQELRLVRQQAQAENRDQGARS